MFILQLDSLSSKGEPQEFHLVTYDLDSAFNTVSLLSVSGSQFCRLTLRLDMGKAMSLPIEVFDGEPMLDDLKALKRQWEEILTCS